MLSVLFPWLLPYGDLGLLLLRLMVAIVFFTSGFRHARDPVARARSIGASPRFTLFLGLAEMAGAVGVGLGIFTQAAAIGLILVMSGSISKKIFVWKTGFWGEKNSGWHYDLLFVVMNTAILLTGGGKYVLL
jgi:putative oxidoreductase